MNPQFCKLKLSLLLLSVSVVLPANSNAQICSSRKFEKKKIVAWCIVPFDSKKRGPEERSTMLNQLGITKLAYDWREEHISSFDKELDALNRHHIKLQAFWLSADPDGANNPAVNAVFSFLKRRKVKTQIWYLFSPDKDFYNLSQNDKVELASRSVEYIAKRADSIGCKVGLYNHESWFGEPENQLAILERLKMPNIGIVYNFNHAQEQIERFPVFFPKLIPHLLAVNLAGLKKGDNHIYPLGEGDSEQEMIKIVCKSKFKGPIGIINENTDPDAETGLRINMKGLKNILHAIGNDAASETYGEIR